MPQELAPSSHQDLFSRQHLPPADQWPVFLFDRPEVQYPDALNAAAELIEPHLQRGHGNRVALHGRNAAGDFQWSYNELSDRVDRIAHVLTGQLGLVSGNR
ncbi:MAG: 2-aminobenzoate-CoA ligase, partial [Betaproteobacteria bacterium]